MLSDDLIRLLECIIYHRLNFSLYNFISSGSLNPQINLLLIQIYYQAFFTLLLLLIDHFIPITLFKNKYVIYHRIWEQEQVSSSLHF